MMLYASDADATYANAAQTMTVGGTLSSFRIATAPNNGTWTFTVVKNGTDTTVTCSTAGGNSCSDTTHTASFVAGDTIAIKGVGGGAKPARWTAAYANS